MYFLVMPMEFFIPSRSLTIFMTSFWFCVPTTFMPLTIQIWKSSHEWLQALSQSDGRWRYNSNNPESSARAAGNYFWATNYHDFISSENCIYMVHISVASLEVPCNHRLLALSCFFKPGNIYVTSLSSYFWVIMLLAGIALEALAGVVSLASSEMDQSMVSWILCWYHLWQKAFKKDVSSVALKSGMMLLHFASVDLTRMSFKISNLYCRGRL